MWWCFAKMNPRYLKDTPLLSDYRCAKIETSKFFTILYATRRGNVTIYAQ